jgi:hypothetical protein
MVPYTKRQAVNILYEAEKSETLVLAAPSEKQGCKTSTYNGGGA